MGVETATFATRKPINMRLWLPILEQEVVSYLNCLIDTWSFSFALDRWLMATYFANNTVLAAEVNKFTDERQTKDRVVHLKWQSKTNNVNMHLKIFI